MLDTTNRYYVYVHLDSDDNVFYVGKGTGDRAWVSAGRSLTWYDKVNNENCKVKLLFVNLSEDEAIQREAETILQYSSTLVNSNNNAKISKLSFKLLDSLFYYDVTSPTFLRWKVPCGRGRQVKKIGDVAGYVGSDIRYGRVWVSGKMMLIHRVIWVLHFGEIPDGLQINHIDNEPSNNHIDNLELVTARENMYKKKKKAKPRLIYKDGVVVSVQISYPDETSFKKHKNFKVSDFNSIEDAVEFAENFRQSKIEENLCYNTI
jgi:hypothetical protein